MARFDVFFSYHWRDHAPVEALARRLRDVGLSVFLDRWYLTPGTSWLAALETTLADCGAVAVCLGQDMGPWQAREQYSALERQAAAEKSGQLFPVIPLLLPGSEPPLGFLRQNTWVDFRPSLDDAVSLAILLKAIRGEPPGPEPLALPDARAQICPYRGLLCFREQDAEFFFGRDAAVDELASMLERKSLVALVGASGAGKSSVVRAGLIPRLRHSKSPVWEFATLEPGSHPLLALASALVPLWQPDLKGSDLGAELTKVAERLACGDNDLGWIVSQILECQPGSERLLLVVDQWEELFTLTNDETERRRFIKCLSDSTVSAPLSVVLTLRGDFFGRALGDRSVADLIQNAQINLGPMTTAELERSIIGPAAKVGLQFEHGLVERILCDVGNEPGHLPLMEFVLTELWEQRQGDNLHHDAYERMGGVVGAIAARADAEFKKLDTAQQNSAKRMLIQMVKPGEETEDTRQRAVLPAGNENALTVIRRLADARLVVTTRDPASGAETVEVTHEALIRHWKLLRTWVDQDREFLKQKARIEASAALWEKDARDPSRLLGDGRALAEGKELLTSRRDDLTASAAAFIEISVAATERHRRRRLLARTVAAVTGLGALLGGFGYWDLFRAEHFEFYNAYAKRWGVFEGVGPVSAEDAKQRSRTLRFTKEGRLGPVVRVDAIDGSGMCAPAGITDPTFVDADALGISNNPTRPCSVKWERDSQERIGRQNILDAMGRPLFSFIFTGGDGRIATAEFKGPEGLTFPHGLGVASTVTFERIESGPNQGQDRFERYTDAAGQPRPFLTGVFASLAEYNLQGLIKRSIFLGSNGTPERNIGGFAEIRVDYDDAGNPSEVAFYDENGQRVRTADGTAGRRMSYDARGNLAKLEYFDERGNALRIKNGYASVTVKYGEGGRETERAFFDESGRPTPNKDGYPRITRTLDSKGRPVMEAYFDELGKPMFSKNGYAKVTKLYDDFDNPVEENYFDQDGKPARNKKGYAKIVRAYHIRGWLIEESYFDPLGQPTLSKDGYARRNFTWDPRGQLIAETYFDSVGKRTLSKERCAKISYEHDGAGHIIAASFSDEYGMPTLSKEGYARVTKQFDQFGNNIEESYFDSTGRPIRNSDQYANMKMAYDANGHRVAEAYFDESGKSALSKRGWARVTSNFDQAGHWTGSSYFDEAGKPTLIKEGYSSISVAYDDYGNEIRYSYFDEAGNPTSTKIGIAGAAFDYDKRGNAIRRMYFDENGRPAHSKDQYSKISRNFDARGNETQGEYFDKLGKLTIYKDGYAKITVAYDVRGNQIENQYFDIGGKPVRSKNGYARLTQAFDDRGNLIEQAYFDEAGQPIRTRDGYAKLTKAYDERGNLSEEAYFDESGNPVRSSEGYARRTLIYDARDNAIRGAYFDETGRPTMDANGSFAWTATFDARGNVIEATALDERGQPMRGKEGHATVRKAFDGRDNQIEASFYDETGKPIRIVDGYAKRTRTYDARSNLIDEAYFDTQGKPIRSKDGYARVAKVYDARGNVIEEAYFDQSGRPIRSKDGYARVSKTFDVWGNPKTQTYFDERAKKVNVGRITPSQLVP